MFPLSGGSCRPAVGGLRFLWPCSWANPCCSKEAPRPQRVGFGALMGAGRSTGSISVGGPVPAGSASEFPLLALAPDGRADGVFVSCPVVHGREQDGCAGDLSDRLRFHLQIARPIRVTEAAS